MTSKDWKICKLGNIIELIGGGTPNTSIPEYWNGNIPWISVKDFNNDNKKVYVTEKTITELGLNKSATKLLQKGDIIISARGTVGEIAVISRPMAFNQSCYGIKAIPNIVQDDFLYYLLKNSIQYLKHNTHGSVFDTITKETFEKIDILLPPLETQEKIAHVLSSLDDKIELNNKINQNLEQQAQAIFKSWFIDIQDSKNYSEKFGNLPKDAIVSSISDIDMLITDYVANGSFASLKENVKLYQEPNYAYFIRNTDLKSNTFNVYVDRHSYDFLSKSVLYGNEIIISNVGDVGSVFLCPKLDKPMTLGNNIIMLRPNKVEMLYYLYIWFKWSYGQDLIQGIKGGSAQPKFNKTDFKSLQIIIPSEGMLNNFNKIVAPMFQIIENNSKEKVFLAQLRDTLLPKLMSGEIDVDKI